MEFRRLKKVVKRKRTILGIVMREVQRKSEGPDFAPDHPKAASDLMMWLERAERIRTQQRNDKNSCTRCMYLRPSASAKCDVKSYTSLSRPLTRLVTRPAVPSVVAYLCMRCWQRRRVKPRGQRIWPSGHADFREEAASPASITADGMPG